MTKRFEAHKKKATRWLGFFMTERVAAPGLRRLPPYWHEYKTRAKTRWYGRQILEVFTTEFRDRTREYYIWAIHQGLCTVNGHTVQPTYICLLYTSPSPRDS